MATDFWDAEELLEEIPKNEKGDVIRIKSTEKKGKKYIDIRTWYQDGPDMKPGKGISIPDDLVDEVALVMLKSADGRREEDKDE